MDARIVILGAGGMLGRAFAASARDLWPGAAVASLDRATCDVTDESSIRSAIAPGVGVVVNCAAWTNVDAAEADEAGADRLNALAPLLLARRCREAGAALVHFSTDYVFAGDCDSPCAVDAPRRPINAYGRSKARGEEAIERVYADARPGERGGFLIIRTSWLYAPHGKNFVRTIAQACREKPSLRVVNDQRGRPTACETLVRATGALLARDARGVFHVSDGGTCTWFEFAREIGARVNPACRIEPCTSDEFPRPAKRPAYSVLDLSRTENLIGAMPDWRVSLGRCLSTMEQASAGLASPR